jgi:hypothetical protein
MNVIRIRVTAEDIGEARPGAEGWADPIERALRNLTGQEVDIDGGYGDGTCVATIGTTGAWALVVDLPAEANEWLNDRWDGRGPGEPFEFDLEVPSWIVTFVNERQKVSA